MMANDFRQLDELGSDYFKNNLLRNEIVEREYDKNKIPIGLRRDGRTYLLDCSDAIRIFFLGKTRTGKTFFLRGVADRFRKAGYDIVFLPDVKGEFASSISPVQEKFRKFLLPNEIPQGMPVVTYRPTFFKQLAHPKTKNDVWWSPRLSAISKADFSTLMNTELMTAPQQVMVEIIYEQMSKSLKAGKDLTLEDIDDIIDGIDDITPAQKTSMKFKFRPLKTSFFIEPENQIDVVESIRRGDAVALNMEYFDSFGKGGFGYPEVSVSLILRDVITARMRKQIRKVLVITDEASRFIPNDRNPSCKRDFMEAVDLFGRYGVYFSFASQELSKMPPEIIRQCRYVFVPYSATVGELKDVMMMTGFVRNIQNAPNQAIGLKGRLKKYDWVVFDTMNHTMDVIRPLAPLSAHMESGD